jgi:hypothetical protein
MAALTLVREISVGYEAHTNFRSHTRSFELHAKGISVSERYRLAQSDMIDILGELDGDKTYLLFNANSLFAYCVKFHKLSEDVICNLIAIVRKSKLVPELKEAIRDGVLTVNNARKIAPVLTLENKSEWLELATTQTSKQIEKAVAAENPKLAIQESLKYKTDDRLELKLGVSEEWTFALSRVKDLVSQQTSQNASTEESLLIAMNCFIRRHDPVEKAKRSAKRVNSKSALEISDEVLEPVVGDRPAVEAISKSESESGEDHKNSDLSSKQTHDAGLRLSVARRITEGPRHKLSSSIKNAVFLRDQGQCTFMNADGVRCACRRWLDVHHVVRMSLGGTNDLDNLRTLCSAHHRMVHEVAVR